MFFIPSDISFGQRCDRKGCIHAMTTDKYFHQKQHDKLGWSMKELLWLDKLAYEFIHFKMRLLAVEYYGI